jgi:hypothetical protein
VAIQPARVSVGDCGGGWDGHSRATEDGREKHSNVLRVA